MKMELGPDKVICTHFSFDDAPRINIFLSKREKGNTR